MLKINNKPLVSYPINIAKRSKCIINDNIFINTDSERITIYVNKLGNFVKFKRPNYLAKKYSLINDVLLHNISWFEKNDLKFEHIVLLEPTSPLTNFRDLDKAIKLYIKSGADSLVSVCKSIREHTNYNFILSKKKYLMPNFNHNIKNRQSLSKEYYLDGSFYIFNIKKFIKNKDIITKKTIGYQIDKKYSYEIDDKLDFICVEAILKKLNDKK